MNMLKGVLLVVLLVAASAVQSGVPALLAQLRGIETQNERGQEFKNLLELELSQGSKVDEVVDLIGDLLSQLKNDQQIEDLEHASKMTRFNLDIKELEINLESLSKERAVTNQFVIDTTNELQSLDQTIVNIKSQLDLLNGREEDIRTARGDEQVAYQHRSQNNNKVLLALNEVLKRLGDAVFAEQDKQGAVLLEADRVAMIEQMKRELGHNNPIAIMVSLTSTFDIPTVTRIIEKLESIVDAVNESQVDEDTHEVNSQQIFQSVIQEITEVRTKLGQDYATNTQLAKKKTNEKVIKERTLEVLNNDVETTQKLLLNNRTQRDQFDSNYQSRSERRAGEIKTVKQAFDLVKQHADRLNAKSG